MKYIVPALIMTATPVLAHPGEHTHPHDGAHWLTLASGLGLLVVAGGLAFAKSRSRK
ncbi:hypothetical protein [Marivita sp.]|uniref:hypothetical protein n=1 Tax=Marivita sp. TaxID=2003365 RepID=UPI003F6AD639